MRFKKLELLGFKTFAEHTEFHFEPGVTAIVGPNGTGKSNCADALKWVLGEQSARELRGGRMEDLIFNGSDRRDPLNYAEVSLTLDNSDYKLPIGYAEVTISRRLYRSGESEYLLNRTQVRLKDIHELLMGTGIGTSAYSLFEQGRIEQIISARPEERREVFEEAAGITKFKSQKREALRKLDETEQNLLRISDVIAEVKRQIQALERQVKKARAYQEQFERLKQLEIEVARYEQRALAHKAQEREATLSDLRAQAKGFTDQLSSEEGRLSAVRAAVARQDELLNQARQQLLSVTHRQETTQSNVDLTRERMTEAQGRASQAQEELTLAAAQVEQLQGQFKELELILAQADENRRIKEEEIVSIQRSLEGCSRAIEEAKRAIAQTQERILEESSQHVGLKNELGKIRQEYMRVEARWNRLTLESAKVAGELSQSEEELKALEGQRRAAQEAADSLGHEKARSQERLCATESQVNALQEKVDSLEKERTRIHSHLELLKHLLASHEGYESGLKTLLTAMDQGLLKRDGVSGVLAELIQVPPEEIAAVEAALGPFAQALVVESVECAERCRAYLERTQAGRVLFLIRERVPEKAVSQAQPAAESPRRTDTNAAGTGATPLIDHVGITPHLEPLLTLLLADTWLVPDRNAARSLLSRAISDQRSQMGDLSARFVTPAGELFTAESELLGSAPTNEGLVVGRASRLESLEVALGHLESELEKLHKEQQQLKDKRQAAEEQLKNLEARFQEKNQELDRLQATSSSAQSLFKKLEEERALLDTEEKEVKEELETLRTQGQKLQEELTSKEQVLSHLQETIASSQEEIARQSKVKEELSVRLASLTAELNSFDQVMESRRASLRVLEETLQGAKAQVAARQEEIKRLCETQVKCQTSSEGLAALLRQFEQEKGEATQEVGRREEERKAVSDCAAQEEKEFQLLSRNLSSIEQKLHTEEMEQAKLSFEGQQIKDRILQVYQMDLSAGSDPRPDPADSRGGQTLAMGGERSALSEEEVALRRQEIGQLNEKLQRMGLVNLASIDEEQELRSRYDLLVTQQNDLLRAKEDLHEAITKINRTTRAMFRETFEAIQKEFQVTFKQLFGGGEARLVLLDEEDLLESGIEIVARPPGKTIQAISLLSGGEKALTTIALLFAIFRVKPSPFCLMDEIDAPLDEANIDRFTRALREFLKDSQFIIITHNKRTITMADIMYGITMEESGVSKIVSVKFKQEAGANGNGANGAADPAPKQPRQAA